MTRIVSLIGLIAILLVAVPSAPVAAQVATPPDSVICDRKWRVHMVRTEPVPISACGPRRLVGTATW